MTSCSNCGAPLAGDQRFCTRCGQRLGPLDALEPPARGAHPAGFTVAALLVAVVLVGAAWLVLRSGPSRIEGAGAVTTAASTAPAKPSPRRSDAPPSSASPDPQAASQAKSVDTLLDESSRSRKVITPELSALATGCDKVHPATVVHDLNTAIHDRTDVLQQLPTLPLAAIPNGPALRQKLTHAMSASVQADRDYLQWAQLLVSSSCHSTDHSGLVAGNKVSTRQATPAKRAFVSMWNPVAKKYGLPHRADTDL
jgi:zinc ribbon protein